MDGKYYSMLLSPNMSLSVEGYLICVNVPICRSGYQEYRGAELEGFDGYEASWHLDPNKMYRVYRPKEEVLHPDTIASFEGKTVVDEHPTGDGNVINIDNERYLSCGHIQNVRAGPPHGDGEVTLQGDIWIKDPTLREKVRPILNPDSSTAIRDISCGYTLKLGRRPDGTLYMYHIRGNHVAVVEKGRAGPRIAIRDSTPPEIKTRKVKIMSIKELILGWGIKAMHPNATPEETQAMLKELQDADKPAVTPPVLRLQPAVDSAAPIQVIPQPGVPSGNTWTPHQAAAHDALDRALAAMADSEKMGKDAFGHKVPAADLKAEVDSFLGDKKAMDEEMAEDKLEDLADAAADGKHKEGCDCEMCKDKAAKDAEEHQDEKTTAEEKDKMAEDKDGYGGKEIDDHGKSVLKAIGDSTRAYLKATKPIVALIASKPRNKRTRSEQVALDSYNSAVRNLNQAGGNSAYSALSKTKIPEGIPALAATDSASVDEAVVVSQFYEGVPYQVGKKRHQDYLAQKGK